MAVDRELTDVGGALLVSLGQLRRRLRQVPVAGELSLPEWSALGWLDREGAMTAAELARREQISPQSMGATVATLEARALVQRRADPTDGRRQVLSLTATGRNLLRSKRSARADQLAAVLAGFSADEVAALKKAAPLIERLAQSL